MSKVQSRRTISLNGDLYSLIVTTAAREGKAASQLVSDAVAGYLRSRGSTVPALSHAGPAKPCPKSRTVDMTSPSWAAVDSLRRAAYKSVLRKGLDKPQSDADARRCSAAFEKALKEKGWLK